MVSSALIPCSEWFGLSYWLVKRPYFRFKGSIPYSSWSVRGMLLVTPCHNPFYSLWFMTGSRKHIKTTRLFCSSHISAAVNLHITVHLIKCFIDFWVWVVPKKTITRTEITRDIITSFLLSKALRCLVGSTFVFSCDIQSHYATRMTVLEPKFIVSLSVHH